MPPVAVRAESSGPDAIARQVLADNPQIQSARLQWEAMKARPDIVGSLPDPVLGYGYFFAPVETRVGAQNQKVGLSQKIPFPGKLALASREAKQEAKQVFWQYQTLVRELILQAKRAYYDLYRIDRSTALIREQIELYEQTAESAQVRYEAGKARQQDVLKAQLAGTELEGRLLDLKQQRAGVLARLNALRNQPDDTPFATRSAVDPAALPDLQRSLALAETYRQELKAADVAIEKGETALKLARRQRLPDFTFSVDYTQVNRSVFSNPPDNGQDAVMASISVNLPIWGKKLRAQEELAARNLAASQAARNGVRNNLVADVRQAWFEVLGAQEQLTLYRENLIPQARQTYDASLVGFEAGEVTFLDLNDSARALLAIELGLVMTETNRAKALALLERAVGLDLREVANASLSSK